MALIRLFAVILIVLMAAGCTKYASMDDMKKLEEAKQAALSSEAELNQKKAEKRQMMSELDAVKSELDEANVEKDAVSKRVAAKPVTE